MHAAASEPLHEVTECQYIVTIQPASYLADTLMNDNYTASYTSSYLYACMYACMHSDGHAHSQLGYSELMIKHASQTNTELIKHAMDDSQFVADRELLVTLIR